MSVYFYDIADKLAIGNARRCSTLEELLESVETVTLHVDGRPGNHGFFGEEEFARMKPRSLFLNLSRGFVVDHAALRRHIESGHIAGAAIDVFPKRAEGRTARSSSPSCAACRNVILTPHIGGSTEEAQQDIGEFVSGKLVDFAEGGATAMSVNLPERRAARRRPARTASSTCTRTSPACSPSINRVLADHGVNVEGQLLRTRDELGYVITDIGTQLQRRGARRAPRDGRHHPPAHHRVRIARPGAPYSSARRLRSALGRCLRLSRTYAWFPRREILRRMAGQPAS